MSVSNDCRFIGRITKDIEVKDAGNTKVVNFSMAVPRDFKREGQPDVDFVDFTVFGKTAEFMGKYAGKGTQAAVNAHLQMDSFTDKEGKNRTRANFIVDGVKLIGSKPNSDDTVLAEPDDIPFA